MICKIPPEGWICSRKGGHEGPCAAYMADGHGSLHILNSSETIWDISCDLDSIPLNTATLFKGMFQVTKVRSKESYNDGEILYDVHVLGVKGDPSNLTYLEAAYFVYGVIVGSRMKK